MMNSLKKAFFLPNKSKAMAFRLILLLHKYWFLTLFCSFKYLSLRIGEQGVELNSVIPINKKKYLIFIFKIFNGINKYWLYNFKCLVRVLAASEFLRKKNIPYTLFLGVKKQNSKMLAHAWLKCDNIYITGSTQEDYQIVTFFTYDPFRK